jgi:hypothetical protein
MFGLPARWTFFGGAVMSDEMEIASNRAFKEITAKMATDPQFAASMRWLGDFFRRWFATAGYKHICRMIKAL